jgi:alanine dehydrogenase
MIIGVPTEIKDHESRVGLVPAGVHALVEAGHRVRVQEGAGTGSAIADLDYTSAGAEMVATAPEAWNADMVVKVKEPLASEFGYLRPGLLLFTYLHLAPLPELTAALLKNKVNAVAYETIREEDGSLPLLTPMSEVAGRLAVQVGAHYLQKTAGGRGMLLGGVPGVPPADVCIVGGGVVGLNSAKMAIGSGAAVTIIDKSLPRLRFLDDTFGSSIITVASSAFAIAEAVRRADLLIGGVLIPGATAPKLVTRSMISKMKRGAVAVDVAVDQGGCLQTTHATTHTDPVFEVDGVIHYCVANMPAAVPRTSTFALTNATLPYVLKLASHGVEESARSSQAIREGVNTYQGVLTYQAVGEAQGIATQDVSKLI